MLSQPSTRLVSFHSPRIVAMIALGLMCAPLATSARAAELVFNPAGFVNANTSLAGKSNPGTYRLSSGDYYRKLAGLSGANLAKTYAGLNFGGSSRAKTIEFRTESAALSNGDAISQAGLSQPDSLTSGQTELLTRG